MMSNSAGRKEPTWEGNSATTSNTSNSKSDDNNDSGNDNNRNNNNNNNNNSSNNKDNTVQSVASQQQDGIVADNETTMVPADNHTMKNDNSSQNDDASNDDDGEELDEMYHGNIAAACDAANAACQKPFRSEEERKEERRAANRRSAKMSRDRKKMEREQLQEKATQLAQMNMSLEKQNKQIRDQIAFILSTRPRPGGSMGMATGMQSAMMTPGLTSGGIGNGMPGINSTNGMGRLAGGAATGAASIRTGPGTGIGPTGSFGNPDILRLQALQAEQQRRTNTAASAQIQPISGMVGGMTSFGGLPRSLDTTGPSGIGATISGSSSLSDIGGNQTNMPSPFSGVSQQQQELQQQLQHHQQQQQRQQQQQQQQSQSMGSNLEMELQRRQLQIQLQQQQQQLLNSTARGNGPFSNQSNSSGDDLGNQDGSHRDKRSRLG